MRTYFLSTIIVLLFASQLQAETLGLLQVSPRNCVHGLYPQPDGPFSAFIFCDDAQGVNLGIILTSPAVFPGKGLLKYGREWSWNNPTQRFWQDPKWASDITGLFWSPSKRFLYISTSEIYGDGGVFQLDLVKRSFKRIAPLETSKIRTEITGYDPKTSTISILVEGPMSRGRTIQQSVE